MRLLAILLISFLTTGATRSQDIIIPTQIFHNYQLVNPAYAGVVEKNEIGANYRYIKHTSDFINDNHHLTSLSYCRYMNKIKSGVGFFFLHHRDKFSPEEYSGGGGFFGGLNGDKTALNAYYFNASYSFRIQIKEHKLIPGFSFNYYRSKYNIKSSTVPFPSLFNSPPYNPNLKQYIEYYNINEFYWDVGMWYQFTGLNVGFSTKKIVFKSLTENPYSHDRHKIAYIVVVNYFHQFSELFSISPMFYFNSYDKYYYFPRILQVGYINTFKKIFSFGLIYEAQFVGKKYGSYGSHYLSPYIGFHIKDLIVLSASFDFKVAENKPDNVIFSKEFMHEQNLNAKF